MAADKMVAVSDDVRCSSVALLIVAEYTHTHSFNGQFSGTTQVSQYQKGKNQSGFYWSKTVSGSGISWAICKSALAPDR